MGTKIEVGPGGSPLILKVPDSVIQNSDNWVLIDKLGFPDDYLKGVLLSLPFPVRVSDRGMEYELSQFPDHSVEAIYIQNVLGSPRSLSDHDPLFTYQPFIKTLIEQSQRILIPKGEVFVIETMTPPPIDEMKQLFLGNGFSLIYENKNEFELRQFSDIVETDPYFLIFQIKKTKCYGASYKLAPALRRGVMHTSGKNE